MGVNPWIFTRRSLASGYAAELDCTERYAMLVLISLYDSRGRFHGQGGTMDTVLEYHPVFFGLCGTLGVLGLIMCTWCVERRGVWAGTGLLFILTAVACAASRIVLGYPHTAIGVICFIVGAGLVLRSFRPSQQRRKQAAA